MHRFSKELIETANIIQTSDSSAADIEKTETVVDGLTLLIMFIIPNNVDGFLFSAI